MSSKEIFIVERDIADNTKTVSYYSSSEKMKYDFDFLNDYSSDIEMINDMDHNVCNLFDCIKKDSTRLASMIMAIPCSRAVYDKS
jgi:hypothetical protein